MAALWTIAAAELMLLAWVILRDIRAEKYRKERDRLQDAERGLNWGDAFQEMTRDFNRLKVKIEKTESPKCKA